MLRLKLQHFGHLMGRTDTSEKPLMLEGLGAGGEGTTEEETVGWHHRLDGQEFEQALRVGDGQGGLACCSPWGGKVRYNWATELNWADTVHKSKKQAKLTYTIRSQDDVYPLSMQKNWKEMWAEFWGLSNVLFLELDAIYTSVLRLWKIFERHTSRIFALIRILHSKINFYK